MSELQNKIISIICWIIVVALIIIALICIFFYADANPNLNADSLSQFCINNGYAGVIHYSQEVYYCYSMNDRLNKKFFAWNGSEYKFEGMK